MVKYFYGLFFAYSVPLGLLFSAFADNEAVAGGVMIAWFACALPHLVWYVTKVYQFRE